MPFSGIYLEMIKIYATDSLFNWDLERSELLEPLLKHPLSLCFLHVKWQQTKPIFYLFLIFHIIFSMIYSGYAILTYADICDQLTWKDKMLEEN